MCPFSSNFNCRGWTVHYARAAHEFREPKTRVDDQQQKQVAEDLTFFFSYVGLMYFDGLSRTEYTMEVWKASIEYSSLLAVTDSIHCT
jgi:hypothetical protein